MSFKSQQAAPGTVVNTAGNRVISATYRNATAGVQSFTIAGTVTQGVSFWQVRLTHAVTGLVMGSYQITVSYLRRPSPSVNDFVTILARTVAQYSEVRATASGADITLTSPIGYNSVLVPVGSSPWTATPAVNTPATISTVIQPGRLVYVNRLGNDLIVSPFTNNSFAEIGIVLSNPTTAGFNTSQSQPRAYQLDVLTQGDVWVHNVGASAVGSTYTLGLAGTLVGGVDIQGQFTHSVTTGTVAPAVNYRASGATASGLLLPILTEDIGVPGGQPYRIRLV